jgi:cytochrome c-type biogenesis protein CcmE
MKEAKDEIYRQKNRWVAVIAIMSFIQIAVGVILTLWGKI